MKRTTTFFAASAMFLAAACKDEAPPVKATPAPAKPAIVSQPVDAGPPTDARLGMMERHAIWKAKKEADEKLAAQLAADERARDQADQVLALGLADSGGKLAHLPGQECLFLAQIGIAQFRKQAGRIGNGGCQPLAGCAQRSQGWRGVRFHVGG